jgi:hypothetical protein
MKQVSLKNLIFKAASSRLDHQSPSEAHELMHTLESLLLCPKQSDKLKDDQNTQVDGFMQIIMESQKEFATFVLEIGTYVHFRILPNYLLILYEPIDGSIHSTYLSFSS